MMSDQRHGQRPEEKGRQVPDEPVRDPAVEENIQGGTPGAHNKGAITGIADTGGSSGAGGVRAIADESGEFSGIPAPGTDYDLFELSDYARRQILEQAHVVAIIGLKDDPQSPGYEVARYLQQHGYRIVPVNPNANSILDQQAYPDLASIPFAVDVVDIFRRPEAVEPHVEEAINKGAGVVWMQLGIRNEEAARRALQAGLQVVMDHCMRQEHHRLIKQN
jgi:hypothetical protein